MEFNILGWFKKFSKVYFNSKIITKHNNWKMIIYYLFQGKRREFVIITNVIILDDIIVFYWKEIWNIVPLLLRGNLDPFSPIRRWRNGLHCTDRRTSSHYLQSEAKRTFPCQPRMHLALHFSTKRRPLEFRPTTQSVPAVVQRPKRRPSKHLKILKTN